MSQENKQGSATAPEKPAPKHKDRASEIANTFEWLITAFILAFVFRAFVMEAFRIPTGSMADTLRGAHFRLRCPQCGYKHQRGFVPQLIGLPSDTVPPGKISIRSVKCPSCGCLQRDDHFNPVRAAVDNGDRILVLKCLYQFLEPKRWDVIVFKNPCNPAENYIKRLIGLPGDKIEIIDGDIYINDQIARKPYMVQKEHWMPIYDNDYQPINPDHSVFNNAKWKNPFTVFESQWRVKEDNPTSFVLDTPGNQKPSTMKYGGDSANDFRSTYAYNDALQFARMPVCSDLRVRLYVDSGRADGRIGVALGKYGILYRGQIDMQGTMSITKVTERGEEILKTVPAARPGLHTPTKLTFANVDHRLILQFGSQILSHDLNGTVRSLEGNRAVLPEVQIFGSGQLELTHVAVFRDTHYTGAHGSRPTRATEGRPFQLREDQFFVLGDNSPNSEDGRLWEKPTSASRGQAPPRAGVVPRDYLVGKAMFVYWPSGFEFPWPQQVRSLLGSGRRNNGFARLLQGIIRLRWIPNVGQMRYIYGGSGKEPPRVSGHQ